MAELVKQVVKVVDVETLKHHPKNPRKGDIESIRESIRVNGFYGALVVQKSTNYVLAGNHRLKAAKAEGITEVPVAFVDVDDETAIKIVLADNRTNDVAEYDDAALTELLASVSNQYGLDGTGFDEDFLAGLIEELGGGDDEESNDGEKYTVNVEPPIYAPQGDCPKISELYDRSNTDQILSRIESSSVDDNMKAFLTTAAHRHTVINYGLVAEYYAHAPATIQRLMEDSALVIVDLESAIERGWAKMSKGLEDAYNCDDEE